MNSAAPNRNTIAGNLAPATVVCLTAAGRGAVASLQVSGPHATQLVAKAFHPASGRPLAEHPLQAIVFGRWLDLTTGEEIVVCRRDDQTLELHCHGGEAAVTAIMQWLCRQGCRGIDWSTWLREAVADPVSADAHLALAHAMTERTAAILWDQAQGALSGALDEIAAAVGAATEPSKQTACSTQAALAQIDELLRWSRFGCHLTTAWRVVLAGPPNVGKSSLINALLGYRRAIVDPTPGTTRDIVTGAAAFDGWPVELSDTAGLRASPDPLEAAGIRLTQGGAVDADLVLWVSDASQAPTNWRDELPDLQTPVLQVRNKCDLLAADPTESLALAAHDTIATSAVTGRGIDALQQAIITQLVPNLPQPGQAMPFRAIHRDLLRQARHLLLAGDSPGALALLADRQGWGTAAGS